MSNVLKIKLQSDLPEPSLRKLGSVSLKYRAMSEIYSKEPLFLFRCGLGSSLLSLNLAGLVELFGFLAVNKQIQPVSPFTDKGNAIVAVLVASILSTIATNPFEVLHQRVVSQELKGNRGGNASTVFQEMRRNRGLGSLYNGFLASLIRNSAFNSILVWILLTGVKFEQRKDFLRSQRQHDRYSIES